MNKTAKMTRPENLSDPDAEATSRNRFGFLNRSSSQKHRNNSSSGPGIGSADSSNTKSNSKTTQKSSKFGKLLRRSMSVMSASSLPRKPVAQKTLSSEGEGEASTSLSREESSSSSIEDYLQEANTVSLSDEESDEEADDITNAFSMFSAPTNLPTPASKQPVSRAPSFTPSAEKTTVKAVKVSRVHSQKSPHIRYAATKFASGDHMDLRSSSVLRKKKPSSQISNNPVRRRSSCPDINNPVDSIQKDTLMETQEFEVTMDVADSPPLSSETSADSITSPLSTTPVDKVEHQDHVDQSELTDKSDTESVDMTKSDPETSAEVKGEDYVGEAEDESPISGSSPESLLDEINDMLTMISVASPVDAAETESLNDNVSEEQTSTSSIEGRRQSDPQISLTESEKQRQSDPHISLTDLSHLSEESLEDLEVQAITANAVSAQNQSASKPNDIEPKAEQAHHLAKYLQQSVYNLQSLEDLDMIRSEKFNLLDEDLSTLDERLTKEFSTLDIEDDWSVIGNFEPDDHHETLMHFASRFGLMKFAKHLLSLRGGTESLDVANSSGLLPSDVAGNESNDELASLLINYISLHNKEEEKRVFKTGSSPEENAERESQPKIHLDNITTDAAQHSTPSPPTHTTGPHATGPQSAVCVSHEIGTGEVDKTSVQTDEGDLKNTSCHKHKEDMDNRTSSNNPATALGLEANIDMLHQLIEEIEIDRRASTEHHVNADPQIDDVDTSGLSAKRNTDTGSSSTCLTSPHITDCRSGDMSRDEGMSASDNMAIAAEGYRGGARSADGEESSGDEEDSQSSLIQPYSETSSGSSTDTEEAPALPPRTWRSKGPQAKPVPAARQSISPILPPGGMRRHRRPYSSGDMLPPSITVSPPQVKTTTAAALPPHLSDTIQLAQENRREIEAMQRRAAEESTMKRFSTSCPSLEDQTMYDLSSSPSLVTPQYFTARHGKVQYKSLLDVTKEEDEEEVNAAIGDSPRTPRRTSGERPKSLDFSTMGGKLSIAGVTDSASTDFDGEDQQSLADKHRRVSFNMFAAGASKEKTKFHQGVATAGIRSFSLGSLGSEDDEEEQRARNRDRSADSTGHVKPIDIYGAPLQKLPNVDFSKHIGQQSDGSTSSLISTSQETLNKPLTSSVSVGLRHSTQTRSALPLPHHSSSGSNLNKSKSVSTPSINQMGDQPHNTNRHSGLFTTAQIKSQHNTDSLRRSGPRRPFSEQNTEHTGSSLLPLPRLFGRRSSLSVLPSNYDDDEKKNKKANRRTSVFAKFGSVRSRGSKSKDKTGELMKRASHNFVAVTLANSICNHCNKLLNYKPSVQCSNCLMNYHDDCKDKVLVCQKQKTRERKPAIANSLTPHPSQEQIITSQNTESTASALTNTNSALMHWQKVKMHLYNRHDSGESMMSPSIADSYSPSMESLVDDGNADDEYEDDPELNIKGYDSESWSETIDKKVIKSMKERSVKRQDNIWEFIASERQYLTNLKIMQRVFAQGMRNECQIPETSINRIFPELEELVDLHQAFLTDLQDRQDRNSDKSVDMIGDLIIKHFGGPAGERLKRSYGIFCSRHKEGIDFYKQLYKDDRKYQSFIKKVSNMTITKRRGVQDLVTVVTMRMTKYLTLIETIIKNTKESKDRLDKENLCKALDLNRDILNHIDASIHSRNQKLRLLEIYSKMDARSTAIYDKIKKFKKSDLTAKNRKLRHEGVLWWRNAREKEVETLVIVLSDVILFLQENDKKYSFFTQDNKASVVPLTNLLVREKGSTKDNRGFYLIRQSRENPEMYELVCRSSQERRDWIDILRKAVNESPEEDEGVINETEEEHREVIAKLAKLKEYVQILDYKDKELEKFCRERFSIIADIMHVYDYTEVLQSIKSCYDDDGELKSAGELIRLSIDEATNLASLYQTIPPSTNLGRSWSSVGERQSPTYQQLPLPKRAETFNGFDQDSVKSPVGSNKTILDKVDGEGRIPSIHNLQQHDSDCEETKPESSRTSHTNRRSSSNILQQILTTTSSSSKHEEDIGPPDSSLLSLSNMLAITAIVPPTKEQAQSVTQLNEYLHGILLVVNKQESLLESVKQELADFTVRSHKKEHDQEKKSALRHNKQMEEIRNRHEQLTKERESLESERDKLNAKLEAERAEVDALREEMAHQQNDLKKEREELQRQKEALQKQVDFYNVRRGANQSAGVRSPSLSPHSTPLGSNSDLVDSSNSPPSADNRNSVEVIHRRSHSAELVEMDNPPPATMFVDPKYSASLTEPLNLKEARAQQLGRLSTSPDRLPQSRISLTGSGTNLSKSDRSGSQGSLKKLSSNNNTVLQQIPSKLVSSTSVPPTTGSSSGGKQSKQANKSVLPMNLAESTSKRSSKDQSSAKTAGTNKKGDVIYF